MSIRFRKAIEEEVRVLTEMSRDAFLSDVEFGGEPGGPTGYDDYEFHLSHQRNGDLYALLDDGKSVKGVQIGYARMEHQNIFLNSI